MTIHQLKEPCWVLRPRPYEDDQGDSHYKTWHDADEALRELRDERGPDPRDLAELEKVQAKANPAGCWVGECDGCLDLFTDGETGANHYETRAEVEASMAPYGWLYQGGGVAEFWPAPDVWTARGDGVLCPGCKPAGLVVVPPLPPPAEQEAAGQLRLPGVA